MMIKMSTQQNLKITQQRNTGNLCKSSFQIRLDEVRRPTRVVSLFDGWGPELNKKGKLNELSIHLFPHPDCRHKVALAYASPPRPSQPEGTEPSVAFRSLHPAFSASTDWTMPSAAFASLPRHSQPRGSVPLNCEPKQGLLCSLSYIYRVFCLAKRQVHSSCEYNCILYRWNNQFNLKNY